MEGQTYQLFPNSLLKSKQHSLISKQPRDRLRKGFLLLGRQEVEKWILLILDSLHLESFFLLFSWIVIQNCFIWFSFNSKSHFSLYFRVFGQRSVQHSQWAYAVLEVAYTTSTRNPNPLFPFVYSLTLFACFWYFSPWFTMKLIELNLQALENLGFHKELMK